MLGIHYIGLDIIRQIHILVLLNKGQNFTDPQIIGEFSSDLQNFLLLYFDPHFFFHLFYHYFKMNYFPIACVIISKLIETKKNILNINIHIIYILWTNKYEFSNKMMEF